MESLLSRRIVRSQITLESTTLYCIVFVHLYSASLSISLSEAPFPAIFAYGYMYVGVCVRMCVCYRQLRMKNLRKFHTRQQEWVSNLRPSERKEPKILLSHHTKPSKLSEFA